MWAVSSELSSFSYVICYFILCVSVWLCQCEWSEWCDRVDCEWTVSLWLWAALSWPCRLWAGEGTGARSQLRLWAEQRAQTVSSQLRLWAEQRAQTVSSSDCEQRAQTDCDCEQLAASSDRLSSELSHVFLSCVWVVWVVWPCDRVGCKPVTSVTC